MAVPCAEGTFFPREILTYDTGAAKRWMSAIDLRIDQPDGNSPSIGLLRTPEKRAASKEQRRWVVDVIEIVSALRVRSTKRRDGIIHAKSLGRSQHRDLKAEPAKCRLTYHLKIEAARWRGSEP